MRKATAIAVIALLAGAWTASAQETDYLFDVPISEDLKDPYAVGIHSGARDIVGPVDLDNDGQMEVVVSDYTGGGRAHVIENVGPNTWEWVYSTPWLDSTATTNNIRAIAAGHVDADDFGDIVFFAGRGYDDADNDFEPGLYVFEFNGTDFGTESASVYDFGDHLPDRWRAERIELQDIDGDDVNEIMWGSNGSDNSDDEWYILSVNGDIGGGFEVWVEEARLSSRASEDFDPVNRGGGSPYYIGAGDFDGDGVTDLTLHSWNSFNLTTGQVLGANSYQFPEDGAENAWYHATEGDDVALFGGTVVDVDQDGNDEVFFGHYTNGEAVLLNYDEGENTMQVTEDNVVVNIFGTPFSALGIGSGDLDGDGAMEIFGSGPGYSGESRTAGDLPTFMRIAEYQGGDVESPSSYAVHDLNFYEPFDTTEAFDTVDRDSAGIESVYYDVGAQGAEFVSKFAYLGDVDGDDFNELAIAFQGVDDSTFTFEETYDADAEEFDRDTTEVVARENRVFMRVLQGTGLAVKVVDEEVILPSNYKLSENYPNPFNPSTSFSFTLPVDKAVSVKVYDVAGRLVKTLVDNEFRSAGTYEVTWNGTNNAGVSAASGTYLYTLEWGQFRRSRTMILVK